MLRQRVRGSGRETAVFATLSLIRSVLKEIMVAGSRLQSSDLFFICFGAVQRRCLSANLSVYPPLTLSFGSSRGTLIFD